MSDRTGVSGDTRHQTSACVDDDVRWLTPRGDEGSQGKAGSAFLQFTASLGLGALLTLTSAGTAIAPAVASPAEGTTRGAKKDDALSVETSEGAPSSAPSPDTSPQLIVVSRTDDVAATRADEGWVASTGGEHATGIDPLRNLLPLIEPAEPIDLSGLSPPRPSMSFASLEVEPTEDDEPIARIIVPVPGAPAKDPHDLLAFDGMRVPRWIVDTILRAAVETNVDPVYLMALADKESSFVPENRARSSSAEGLFQFIESTWLEMIRAFGRRHGLDAAADAVQGVPGDLSIPDEAQRTYVLGLRRDPYLSALMAAEMMKRDRERLERRLGRSITRSEFYLAHFFGVESATRFMSLVDVKPKVSAPKSFPAAARANRALFYARAGRKTRQLSVKEVYGRLDAMMDARLDRYASVETVGLSDLAD